MRTASLAALLGAALALSACKFVPTAEVAAMRQAGASGGAPAFDPDKMAADLWGPKVLPYMRQRAGEFSQVRALATSNPDQAGQTYGYRAKADGGTPWTLMVKLTGRIVAANTESRAATLDVDTDGDGKADATVQIGPAIRGTALRDSLDFVSFNSFTNQIDFARFGKSFNTLVDKQTLSALPRTGLVGRQVTVLGAYPLSDPGKLPLITPAEISLGAAS